MTTADDLRDLRDALDCIAHGALPRWGTATTKSGEEAQAAAREVYEKFVRALFDKSDAEFTADCAKRCVNQQRAHAEALTAQCEAAEAKIERLKDRCTSYSEDVESLNECVARLETALYEARDEAVKMRDEWKSRAIFAEQELSEAKRVVDRLRAERRQLRRRLLECRSWVGVCPVTPARINEMCLIRDLADDTLNEVQDDD
jgi:predicted RNase H-like nuclease (RuvC/YqgF family)